MTIEVGTAGTIPLAVEVRPGEPGGAAVCFINSLGTDHRVWDPLLPHLPAAWHLLRHDKRGHGLSGAAPTGSTIADYTDDVAALIRAQGRAPMLVVGLSIGGLIAQSLAARHPDLVQGLILICTGAKIGTPALWQERIDGLSATGLPAAAESILDRWFPEPFRSQDPSLPLWRAMLHRADLAGYLVACAAIRDADLRNQARTLSVPTLCIAGSEDQATPPVLLEDLAQAIPGARLAVLQGAGHIPCVQMPGALAALMKPFVEQVVCP